MNPATYLRVNGPEPWNVCYVEPSIRPDDSRYGLNPNRLQRHTQVRRSSRRPHFTVSSHAASQFWEDPRQPHGGAPVQRPCSKTVSDMQPDGC